MNFEDNNKEGINKLEKGILYDVLFKHSPDFVFIHDINGNLIKVNNSLKKILGYKNQNKKKDLSLKDIVILNKEKPNESDYLKFLKEIIKKSVRLEYKLKTKKDKTIDVEGYSIPSAANDLNSEIFIHIAHDISGKKEIQKKLIASQKEIDLISSMIPELRLWSLSQNKDSLKLIQKSGQAVKESVEKYKNILENIQEGYFEIDLNGNFIFFNKALCRILGYSGEELINLPYEMLMDDNTANHLKLTLENLPKKNIQLRIRRKNNEEIFVETSLDMKFNSNNEKIGYFGILRDISQRIKVKKLEIKFREELENEVKVRTQKLNELLEKQKLYMIEISKASNFKSELLSSISHELRTPLNAIIGFTDLLLERSYGKLTEEQNEFLNDIKYSAEHLLDLITKILDISKIEAGQIALRIQKFSLNIMIEQIKSNLRLLIKKKGLKFKLKGLDTQKEIYADPIKFKEIVYNLLSNAIKYTIKGKITFIIQEDKENWVFKIKDTGIGIALKNYDLVFKEFKRINTPYVKSIPGTGLGLSITKRLVNLHGGDISFTSKLGVGSTFTFIIPKSLRTQAIKVKKS